MLDKRSQVLQLNEFLDELPEVPRDKVCVDSSEGYQAYSAMNFGKIGDRAAADVQLKDQLQTCLTLGCEAPDLGGIGGLPLAQRNAC